VREHGYELEHVKTTYPEIQAESLEDTIRPGLEWLMQRHKVPLMIDDSGLFIDSLKGFPGVYSSYVFKTVGSARFECCIGFMVPGGEPHISKGVAKGSISQAKEGTGGFGYDPIFVPEGYSKTYAQLEVVEKNRISHRGRAMALFLEELPRLLP
jgi:XTP/dITP diphosphohydrolase